MRHYRRVQQAITGGGWHEQGNVLLFSTEFFFKTLVMHVQRITPIQPLRILSSEAVSFCAVFPLLLHSRPLFLESFYYVYCMKSVEQSSKLIDTASSFADPSSP